MSHPSKPIVAGLLLALAVSACQESSTPNDITGPPDDIGPAPPMMNPLSMEVEGYPEAGELRTGYIYDRMGAPIEITFEIQEGLAIWQGDIILGEVHEIATSPAELASSNPGPIRGVVIDADGGANRWPGGVIPYTINAANPPTQSIVDQSIDMIEDQTPGVTLVPRTGEADYVTFQNATGCSSEIGRVGGQQFINLKVNDGDTFCSAGNAAHEILHALGMFHEHTRCDRDDFVTIDYGEIESGREGNFYKAGSGSQGGDCSGAFDIDTYDPGSIMHYGQFAFAVGSNPTIIPKTGVDGSAMGQRDAVGPTDQETIDQLYGANNAAPSPSIAPLAASYPEGTAVPFDASGTTDADDDDDLVTFAWTFGDGTCPGPTACTQAAPSHPYADNGTYAYSLEVSDGFDDNATGGSIDITNVAPAVDAGADDTVDEGSEWTRDGSFTDPGADTWNATVDYGDGGGASALALTGKTFSLAHTYVDNSVNTVTVEVTDDDGGVGSDDAEVTVLNVAPTVNAGPDAELVSGESLEFSGSFSDPGIEDDPWEWVIDWGFGTNSMGSTDDQSAPIEVSHQVCAAGMYTVELSVTDKDGGEGTDDLVLTVPHATVGINIKPLEDPNAVGLRGNGTIPVAVLGSADLDVNDIDPATLSLGDGLGADTPIDEKNSGKSSAYFEDVDFDGFMDLVVMFSVKDMVDNGDLNALSVELVLRGFLTDGCTNIQGTDTVRPVGR